MTEICKKSIDVDEIMREERGIPDGYRICLDCSGQNKKDICPRYEPIQQKETKVLVGEINKEGWDDYQI